MTDRYAVRREGMLHGVWDAATNGWHGRTDLPLPEAEQLAAELNAKLAKREQEAQRGPYRSVDPPKPVILSAGDEQHFGTLDAWSRESGQWWGRVTIGAHGGWYPAAALRQA